MHLPHRAGDDPRRRSSPQQMPPTPRPDGSWFRHLSHAQVYRAHPRGGDRVSGYDACARPSSFVAEPVVQPRPRQVNASQHAAEVRTGREAADAANSVQDHGASVAEASRISTLLHAVIIQDAAWKPSFSCDSLLVNAACSTLEAAERRARSRPRQAHRSRGARRASQPERRPSCPCHCRVGRCRKNSHHCWLGVSSGCCRDTRHPPGQAPRMHGGRTSRCTIAGESLGSKYSAAGSVTSVNLEITFDCRRASRSKASQHVRTGGQAYGCERWYARC